MSAVRLRIILVEDDVLVANATARLLRALRHDVRIVLDSRLALDAVRDHPPDVVISDLRMPHVTGEEVLAMVRNRHPNIARLLVSGSIALCTDPTVYDEALPKPCNPEDLIAAIASARRKHAH